MNSKTDDFEATQALKPENCATEEGAHNLEIMKNSSMLFP